MNCIFWDPFGGPSGSGGWSEEGCKLIESNGERTLCACHHLSTFAISRYFERSIDRRDIIIPNS
jgi:hypothetical protein